MAGKRNGRRAGLATLLIIAGMGGFGAAQAAESYRVRLTTVPIEARTSADVKGSGTATAVLDGTRLTITGTFGGLQSAATHGAVHESPVRAVRGPSIAEFTVPSAQNGTFSAALDLTPQQIQTLAQGRIYVQIHSAGAPDGNLWGWLLR